MIFRISLTFDYKKVEHKKLGLWRNNDDAQDAAQETFVRIFRSFRHFKGECSLSAWIYRIATHEALRIWERRKDERLSLDDPEAHPFSLKEETDSFSHVEQAFANLSQEDQAYMLAVYQEDIFMNE